MTEVKLLPHVGKQRLASGETIDVEHDQWIVELDGRRMGYLGKSAPCGMCFIRHVDDETVKTVLEGVSDLAGRKVTTHSMPPPYDVVLRARRQRDGLEYDDEGNEDDTELE